MVLVQADFNTTEINARINKLREQIESVIEYRCKFYGTCENNCLPDWYRKDRPKEVNALVSLAQEHVTLRNTLLAELQAHLEVIAGALKSIDDEIGQFNLPKFKSPIQKKK